MLDAKACRYLLTKNASEDVLHGIKLHHDQGHLINGHFVYASFITIREQEKSVLQAIHYLYPFFQASGSSNQ